MNKYILVITVAQHRVLINPVTKLEFRELENGLVLIGLAGQKVDTEDYNNLMMGGFDKLASKLSDADCEIIQ